VKASGKFCLSNPVFTNPDNYRAEEERQRKRKCGRERWEKEKARKRKWRRERWGKKRPEREREKKEENTVLNVKMQELKCLW
jgi:hypothetical protein